MHAVEEYDFTGKKNNVPSYESRLSAGVLYVLLNHDRL